MDSKRLEAFKERPIGTLVVGGLIFILLVLHSKASFFTAVFPIVISLITYFVYAKDKAAARADKQRTSENTLHILSLIGGWPGAFIAQTLLRHKLRKNSFMTIFWLTVILNIVYIYWSKFRFL